MCLNSICLSISRLKMFLKGADSFGWTSTLFLKGVFKYTQIKNILMFTGLVFDSQVHWGSSSCLAKYFSFLLEKSKQLVLIFDIWSIFGGLKQRDKSFLCPGDRLHHQMQTFEEYIFSLLNNLNKQKIWTWLNFCCNTMWSGKAHIHNFRHISTVFPQDHSN